MPHSVRVMAGRDPQYEVKVCKQGVFSCSFFFFFKSLSPPSKQNKTEQVVAWEKPVLPQCDIQSSSGAISFRHLSTNIWLFYRDQLAKIFSHHGTDCRLFENLSLGFKPQHLGISRIKTQKFLKTSRVAVKIHRPEKTALEIKSYSRFQSNPPNRHNFQFLCDPDYTTLNSSC